MKKDLLPFKGDLVNNRFTGPGRRSLRRSSGDPGDLARPVGEWSPGDADAAVAAARAASPRWAALPPAARLRALGALRRALVRHGAALECLITREMGKLVTESRAEVSRLAARFDVVAGEEARLIRPERHPGGDFDARLVFRPRGVVAVLAPFNLPAHLALSPAVSALAAGNTVVLKPSELTPFVGQTLAEAVRDAALPPGVLNITQGAGEAGRCLAAHPGVDALVFTGSWATGRKVLDETGSVPGKICALEMGGKNAAIVLPDADLDLAVREAVEGAFMTSGQRCNSTSRIILHRRIAEQFVERFLRRVDRLVVGYGLQAGADLGPVASEKGFRKVLSALRRARAEGFEVLRAGGPVSCAGRKGYYLAPSVHRRARPPAGEPREGTYADDEVFGPDAAVYVARDLDEALALNNRGLYGLVTSVFGRRRADYEAVVRGARTGLVNWNAATSRSSGALPFGGLGRSGNGRPVGLFSPFISTVPTACLERKR